MAKTHDLGFGCVMTEHHNGAMTFHDDRGQSLSLNPDQAERLSAIAKATVARVKLMTETEYRDRIALGRL